jgi:hypothetical protein
VKTAVDMRAVQPVSRFATFATAVLRCPGSLRHTKYRVLVLDTDSSANTKA